MKILAHIHSFNDEEVIAQSVRAIAAQTRPVDEILIIDNASTDGTLDVELPVAVTLIRNEVNLGTSGTVHMGLQYGLEHGYDWVWIFDADSAPRPDALEKLLEVYDGLSEEKKHRVHRICSLPIDVTNQMAFRGLDVTPTGFKHIMQPPDPEVYECTSQIWSGSLFQASAVREVGLPSPDYVLDWGDNAHGYHAIRKGYRTYMVQASILDHNIDHVPTAEMRKLFRIGRYGFFNVLDLKPVRWYYLTRNLLYFWIYEYHERNLVHFLRILPSLIWIPKHLVRYVLYREWAEFVAIVRGLFDGILGRMDRRY